MFQYLTFRNLVSPFEIKVGMQVVPMEFSHHLTVPVRDIGFKWNLTSFGYQPGLVTHSCPFLLLALQETQRLSLGKNNTITVITGRKSHSSLEYFSKWITTDWWHNSHSKAKNKNYMFILRQQKIKTDWKTYDIPSSSKLYKQLWHLQSSACLLKCGFTFNVCWHLSLCAEINGRTTVCAFYFSFATGWEE